ncbi:MAG TPA: DNA adenine methylase [Candidatus Polarisedimenticolia bacterium]|nr:DNA adenine methylase [Candidatus Polarisedimenticolia bacterium]
MAEADGTRWQARPFLKWAGGKRQLLPRILERFPSSCSTYYEAFLGSGALFFTLAGRSTFRHAVLSDRNRDLVDTYAAVRDRLDDLVAALRALSADRDSYYRIRALDPQSLDPAGRAARFIYLNRTCYNGLYRVNRAGRFNVPFGRYPKPRIIHEENLHAVSRALRHADLLSADFEEATAGARRGDAIYFDPPYVPLSATARFTAYDAAPFGWEEQRRLAALMHRLADRGVFALLSNAGSGPARALYGSLPCDRVRARRSINSRADRRGDVPEILVRTRAEI